MLASMSLFDEDRILERALLELSKDYRDREACRYLLKFL